MGRRRRRDWRGRAPAAERRTREEIAQERAWMIQDEVGQLGLTMAISYPHQRASHWRFFQGKTVVAEYWPTTERFMYYVGRRRFAFQENIPLSGLTDRVSDLCPTGRLDRDCDALLGQSYT